ncbi:hypothetical protein PSTG_10137 [Puccinia striiformis f. sp. tritici PST-78]|uniref:CCHC-type domain-containing protein n=1 Tax=Puccinia striiformis f. sp. tritici PST-78 TaxID=1165861 RepID=A0A0L0VC78_9BASI|nr:hypothetical protein PSTG_10137 [Puccinia striiformis f. sp. tritici PST-78]
MPVQHLPKATNVTIRAQRGSQMAPAPPADGKFYTPAELAAMTNDEQLYLAEHPRFWVVNPDDHQEDFSNDEFADPDSSPSYVGSASGDTHMSDSGTVIADKGKTGTNSLGLGLPARQFTPSVTVGQPPAPLITSTYSISQVNNNNTRMASTSNNTNGGGSSKRTRDSSRACFNCGGDNHVSSNCTEPKTAKQLKYEAKRAASSSSKTLNV